MNMHCRKGFTLIEVMVVSGLMVFLTMLLSSAWANLGVPTMSLIRRSQCMQEIDMAVASLARDLGGCLPTYTGKKGQGRHTNWLADSNTLTLYFNEGNNIRYYVDSNRLIRKNLSDNTTYTAARNVNSMTMTDYTSTGGYIQIDLTFQFLIGKTYLTRKCTLQAKKPPLSSD